VCETGGGSVLIRRSISAPYEQTVCRIVRLHSDMPDRSAGDPAKVAELVLSVADLEEPPVRLLVGSDAYHYAQQVARARMETDEKWRELSVSTDHDDATAADIDPLAVLN